MGVRSNPASPLAKVQEVTDSDIKTFTRWIEPDALLIVVIMILKFWTTRFMTPTSVGVVDGEVQTRLKSQVR